MDRLPSTALGGHAPVGRPDMTVLEAADEMERVHETRLLVRGGDRFLGVLTEDDIVRKVLRQGRRPDLVHVADVMRAGWQRRDGTLLLEERAPELDYEPLVEGEIAQGKCEECGGLSVDLLERDGLLLCGDCRDADRALAP